MPEERTYTNRQMADAAAIRAIHHADQAELHARKATNMETTQPSSASWTMRLHLAADAANQAALQAWGAQCSEINARAHLEGNPGTDAADTIATCYTAAKRAQDAARTAAMVVARLAAEPA